MKKTIISVMAILFTAVACADFDIAQPNWEVRNASCVAVPTLNKSQTIIKATSKLMKDDESPAGNYYIVLDGASDCTGAVRVTKINDVVVTPPTEPEPPIEPPVDPEPPVTPPPEHHGLPFVDTSKNITPAIGKSIMDIVETSNFGSPAGETAAFRMPCDVSHMSNNDPIVYPNQQGASHHHTFFGNTDVDHTSTAESIRTSGNSTCAGGIANRSAYWVPSMIDTSTDEPIAPLEIGVYYKTDRHDLVQRLPEGLRMIAKPRLQEDGDTRFQCTTPDAAEDLNWRDGTFPQCSEGQRMKYSLSFPNCWDGQNLDSPNHTDHITWSGWMQACPASHPVMLPSITFNVFYRVGAGGTSSWRLASDKADQPAGYSIHGDWVNGWDSDISNTFVDNCLKANKDCNSFVLGDGRALAER